MSHCNAQAPEAHTPERWLAGSFGQSALVQQAALGMQFEAQTL
jgi:hypothetical protein